MAIRVVRQSPKRRPVSLAIESDEVLMRAIQGAHVGHENAYSVLISRHRGLMWRVAKKTLIPSVDIDDALQEIALTLWNSRALWRPGVARFSTWLYRLSVNKCIDLNRAADPRHAELHEDFVDHTARSAEDHIQNKQINVLLQEALTLLPLQQRVAMSLHYYNDLSVEEMAARMKTTQQAVRSLLKRAKKNLRLQMPVAAHQEALLAGPLPSL